MNIQSRKWLINRRHVLRGLGVSMALPLLDCMATDKTAPPPRRSVFIYLPNGVNTHDYQIKQAGAGYEFSAPLKPLEKHRDVITPFSGLYNPNGLGTGHECQANWLTGAPLGRTAKNTISVDQLMAQVHAPATRFASLELAEGPGGAMAVSADGIALPTLYQPSVVFRELFQGPAGGIEQQRLDLHRWASILDANLDEARALQNRVGKDDRDRLDQYLTAVRETEIRTHRAESWLDVPRPEVDKGSAARLSRDVSQTKLGEYFRVMYDLIVLAFQTDQTRVATFSTGHEGKGLPIPELGIVQNRHSLSHHGNVKKHLDALTQSDTFNIEQFGYFLTKLRETSDAHGPLLDTTMVLYGSAMAYGHSHGCASLPIVLAGGSKLGLKHGRHIDFNQQVAGFQGYDKHPKIHFQPVNEKAHLSNLLLTMAQKMGVETERFADSNGTIDV
jgi:hypothetical protein